MSKNPLPTSIVGGESRHLNGGKVKDMTLPGSGSKPDLVSLRRPNEIHQTIP